MISDKKLQKIEKILGEDSLVLLEGMSSELLKNQIVTAEKAIKDTLSELEANPKYHEIKESLKALTEGLKEVKKRQNATIQYILHLLEEKGE